MKRKQLFYEFFFLNTRTHTALYTRGLSKNKRVRSTTKKSYEKRQIGMSRFNFQIIPQFLEKTEISNDDFLSNERQRAIRSSHQ